MRDLKKDSIIPNVFTAAQKERSLGVESKISLQANPHLRAPPDARATACSARGARRGLAASLSARAAPPGAACDTAPAPPPPPLPACRPSSSSSSRRRRRRRLHHATSALSPSLRRSPPSWLHRLWRPRGEAVGEGGPERTAIGVRGGGTEKPSPPWPGRRRRRGRGTETALPQAPADPPWRGPAGRGHFYLQTMAPASRTPSRAPPDAPDPPPGFPAALASGRPLKSRLPATSDFSWGLS
ncbi:scavenger receptor class F member 2-like [Peromyscus leucopus]|uniref:scavenger receptor class F member 2-like n=1 Tax=Peromyscus leucopus TaxID=10041 RepID=UPI0018859D38|nr:scavenger receptor class F member 2-like [Peromyscus leucopus]